MGTSQSKGKCGCFGSQDRRHSKEHRIRSCVTEVTMENTEREINRAKARQRIAKQKGYLKHKGSKIQKTNNIQSQQDCQHLNNQQDRPLKLSSCANSRDNVDTVGAIFSRLIGEATVNQVEANEVSSNGSSVDKKQSMAVDDNEVTVEKPTSSRCVEKGVVAEIVNELIAKAVDIAEQKNAAVVADLLDEVVAKAVDIAEQEKAVVVADLLDEVVAKAVDIAEQEKAVVVADLLNEVVAKAVDIAEQEKVVMVADLLDEVVAKAVDIAEQEKAVVVADLLDEVVAKAVDIAEQEKVVVVADLLDKVLGKAFDIAEQEKVAVVTEILDEAVAEECRPLVSENVPSFCNNVVEHDELLKSAEKEDEVSVEAEPLMVPSKSCKGSWVRQSAATKQSSVIMAETGASLYKPCQLKEAFKQTRTPKEIKNLQQKVSMSPFRDPLCKELYSGNFTILDSRDHSGCAIAVFVAQGHSPATAHEVVMNNIYIQLNQAVKSPQTQASGIILLYDFSKAHYKASDLQLFAKILQLFKTAFPVPLKRTLLISAPFWLEAELRLLGLRVRHQDRIEIVMLSKLKQCLPVTCLPEDLGGNNHDDHVRWIEQCLAGYVDTFGSDEEQNGWTKESVALGDVASGVESDVEDKHHRPSTASPTVIWQEYPRKSGRASLEDPQSELKSIAIKKVQNRERQSSPPNLIWQTSPEKSAYASLRAVPSELKSESRKRKEETTRDVHQHLET